MYLSNHYEIILFSKMASPGDRSSNLSVHNNHLKDLVKHKLLGSTLPISPSVDLGRSQRIYIINKLSGNGNTGGSWNTSSKIINIMVLLNVLCITIPEREMAQSLIKWWPSCIFLFRCYVGTWTKGYSLVHRCMACLGWKGPNDLSAQSSHFIDE